MTGRPRRRAVRSAKLGFQVSAFQISEFHSRLSFVRSRCFRRGERSTRKAREPHTEARVEAPVPRAHSRRSRSARAIVELALSTLLLVHPLSAMSADEKNEAAAALPEGDGEFTPTLWSVTGPTETKRPEPGSGGKGDTRVTHESDAAADEPAEAVPLSKNARKRLAKQQAWEAKKKAKKEEEKALKQQKGEEARAAFAAKMEAMTDAERAEYEAVRKANREKRYGPQGSKCDGSAIGFSSLCCEGDQYTPCLKPPCKNYQGKTGDFYLLITTNCKRTSTINSRKNDSFKMAQ